MAGKSKARLEAENLALRNVNIYTMITETGRTGLKYGAYVLISHFIYKSILALSGKSTDVKANILANVSFGKEDNSTYVYVIVFLLIVSVTSIIYGIAQKRLRSSEISRMQGRIQQLESIIDPYRKSSGLAENGETNPKDE